MLLALALHITLGWAWTMIAGIIGGFGAQDRGWLVGALGVGLSWLLIILWNLFFVGGHLASMVQALGAGLGNVPGVVLVAVSLMVGVILGALSGYLGQSISALVDDRAPA